MAIYAKKINSAQRRMLNEYEKISGFEPMCQEDIDSGECSFAEAWQINIGFLENVLADVINIDAEGSGV